MLALFVLSGRFVLMSGRFVLMSGRFVLMSGLLSVPVHVQSTISFMHVCVCPSAHLQFSIHNSKDVPEIILHCSSRHGRVLAVSGMVVHTPGSRVQGGTGVQEKLWTKLCTQVSL